MLATEEVGERRTRREIGRGVGGGGPRICIQLIQIYNRLYIRVASILFSGVARLVADTSIGDVLRGVKSKHRYSRRLKTRREPNEATIRAKLGTSRLV